MFLLNLIFDCCFTPLQNCLFVILIMIFTMSSTHVTLYKSSTMCLREVLFMLQLQCVFIVIFPFSLLPLTYAFLHECLKQLHPVHVFFKNLGLIVFIFVFFSYWLENSAEVCLIMPWTCDNSCIDLFTLLWDLWRLYSKLSRIQPQTLEKVALSNRLISLYFFAILAVSHDIFPHFFLNVPKVKMKR